MESKTINAELFKQIFGLYATEIWAMPEPEFLEWLRREPKRGTWLPREYRDTSSNDHKTAVECSECHTHWNLETRHCPHCGLPMKIWKGAKNDSRRKVQGC